jgi:hypothetical protein
MATKKSSAKNSSKKASKQRRPPAPPLDDRGQAAFPYTTRPGSLRRFLAEVPRRPRPTRVNKDLLASWGMRGAEDYTIVRVLKAVGLVTDNNEPSDNYTAFMRAGTGPTVLAGLIRRTYAPLFEASHQPHREPTESLQNLFNIHSGGATIELQIQTFRALCDFADFEAEAKVIEATGPTKQSMDRRGEISSSLTQSGPPIHIDLHIHLPAGKTSRDYQYIIQDIAKYLYGVSEMTDDKRDE